MADELWSDDVQLTEWSHGEIAEPMTSSCDVGEQQLVAGETVLSIASNQSLLCERVAKDLLAECYGIRRPRDASIHVMRETFHALETGGVAPTTMDPNGPQIELPPAPDETTREAAHNARLTVEMLARCANDVLATPSNERTLRIKYLLDISDTLLEASEAVIGSYAEHFAQRDQAKIEVEPSFTRAIADVVGRLRLVAADTQGMIAELREAARGLNEAAGEQKCLAGSLAGQASAVRCQATETIAVTQDLTAAISEVRMDVSASSDCVSETQQLCQGAQGAMTRLHERAQSIDKSIAIVEDVCSRTRLLALNARIEAARAGPVGAGFRVVADEVKTLSGESAEASSTIEHDLNQVRDETTTTLECVDDVVAAMSTVAGL
ncbi:MAG: methyl-accepting chemotaxis protein, partial [Myxococcota bacterium]